MSEGDHRSGRKPAIASRRSRLSNRAVCCALAAGAVAACLSGCTSFPWQKVPLDVASGFYSDATLTYRLDAGKLGQPLDVVRVENQRVSYEQVASSPLPDESIGTLTITLPHPSGRPGTALAQFTLTSAKAKPAAASIGWNLFVKNPQAIEPPTSIASTHPHVYESWELDISRGEVDQILKLLTSEGFYQRERAGHAQIAVKMDGVALEKPWSEMPALNLLAQRVRTAGRLVAYSRPTMGDGSAVPTIASTAAYAELWARGGAGVVQPPTMASAFALPRIPDNAVGWRMPPGFPATGYPTTAAQPGPGIHR